MYCGCDSETGVPSSVTTPFVVMRAMRPMLYSVWRSQTQRKILFRFNTYFREGHPTPIHILEFQRRSGLQRSLCHSRGAMTCFPNSAKKSIASSCARPCRRCIAAR